jgi:hypothetical protein
LSEPIMDLPKLLQSLPFLLLAAEAPSSCAPAQKSANSQNDVAVAPAQPPLLGDLSVYSTTDLETYENYCDVQVKSALGRGDTAGAQGWARVRSAIAAEKERRTQQTKTQPTPERHRRRSWHGSTRLRRPRYKRPPPETSQPTPEKYPLPPGWPEGPKE